MQRYEEIVGTLHEFGEVLLYTIMTLGLAPMIIYMQASTM
mgnify:FL=1